MAENNNKLTGTANDFLDKNDHSEQAKMIRKAYNNMDCMSAIYSPDYCTIYIRILFGILITCFIGFLIGVFIFLMIRYPSVGGCIGLSIATVFTCLIWVCVINSLNCGLRNVYFYKHNGKLVTIHYRKHLKYLAICLDNDKFYLFNFRKKRWKEKTIKYGYFMGTYLLFHYYFSDNSHYDKELYKIRNKTKYQKNERLTIISEQDYKKYWRYCTYFKFEKDNLISIKSLRHYLSSGKGEIQIQYLLIKDTNIVHCNHVPKSFIDFCGEQGIEAPEECEHLHYV